MKNSLPAILLLLPFCIAFTQCKNENTKLGQSRAEKILHESLKDTVIHNYVQPVLKDSATAVSVAEPILFGIYGRNNILRQKPYEIHHIDYYWVLEGTLVTGIEGGTFLIILDDRNSKVIRISHGK